MFFLSNLNSAFAQKKSCKTDKYKTIGYPSRNPSQAYAMSKVAITSLTKLQQKNFDSDKSKKGIIVSVQIYRIIVKIKETDLKSS